MWMRAAVLQDPGYCAVSEPLMHRDRRGAEQPADLRTFCPLCSILSHPGADGMPLSSPNLRPKFCRRLAIGSLGPSPLSPRRFTSGRGPVPPPAALGGVSYRTRRSFCRIRFDLTPRGLRLKKTHFESPEIIRATTVVCGNNPGFGLNQKISGVFCLFVPESPEHSWRLRSGGFWGSSEPSSPLCTEITDLDLWQGNDRHRTTTSSGSYVVTPAGGRTPLPGQLEPRGPLVSVKSDFDNIPAVRTQTRAGGGDAAVRTHVCKPTVTRAGEAFRCLGPTLCRRTEVNLDKVKEWVRAALYRPPPLSLGHSTSV
ncbi:hypothetical protein INR49_006324 [Caranx melampygus]|nr:hypothetical protein INR49_006324 [Caranx melampygus]